MEWNRRWRLTQGLVPVMFVALAFMDPPVLAAGQSASNGPGAQVTFAKDIAPILQRSCQSCHRPNSIAPMSLITYEEVRPWARSIKHRTSLGSKPDVMPPWYIDKTIGIQHYKDDMSLSDAEIAKIATWVDAGAPRGNPVDMPPPLKIADAKEWRLGTPDLIVSSPAVEVLPTQPDWWGALAPVATGLSEDRYVASVEIKEVTDFLGPMEEGSGKRQTVGGQFIIHHASYMPLVVDKTGKRVQEGTPGGEGGGWPVHEVGRNPDVFDPEAGKLLRAGSQILFPSVHTHANGRRIRSHLELGFKFHPEGYRPKKNVESYFVRNRALDIRGNEADQRFEAFAALKENMKVTIFEPHMHAAGVKMCLDAIWGNTEETLTCTGYNHGWVRIYTYADDAQPLLPKGTVLRVTSYFDTTPANRNVSDSRNWTGLGNRSIDNMAIGVVTGIPLSNDEFEQEIAKRRHRLRLTGNQTTIGCPLCGVRVHNASTDAAPR